MGKWLNELPCDILYIHALHDKTYIYIAMMNLNNQECVYVCVLNTKPNILHSHIPPKERVFLLCNSVCY